MARARKNAVVFLGGGRITSALCAGLRLSGYRSAIVVYDRNPAKLRMLRRESQVEVAHDLQSAIARADLLILAIRPGSVGQILREIAQCGGAPGLCVSLAAGIPLSALQAAVPARWVRAMPSPVCRVGRGLTALSFYRGVTKKERISVRRFFERVGQVVEVSERKFDAFTVTYSSSHGYHALRTLSEAAQRAGLDRATALVAAAHALGDGIAYWRESEQSLRHLLHEAATPGGVAAATMDAMDRARYARVVETGIRSGIKQARRNARGSWPVHK